MVQREKLINGRYYWVRSKYYGITLSVGQYIRDGKSLPTFSMMGDTETYYAHKFEVLMEAL